MNKEQQDLAWACLPKEMRADMRHQYKVNPDRWSEGWNAGLKYYFGDHNLTSDTEPEEMLMVERKKVQEVYEKYRNISEPDNRNRKVEEWQRYLRRGWNQGGCGAIGKLFGDKCLPDKEEPKFKVEDIVKVNNPRYNQHFGATGVIKSIEEFVRGTYVYTLENDTSFIETSLEPYTEKNKETMEESTKREGWDKAFKEYAEKGEDDKLLPDYLDSEALEKEEELNLCELVKVGDTIYSPTFGERIVRKILPDRLCDSTFICYKNGKIWDNGEVIIYPSRALYEKYPLDARAAWMEWKESRKPKYILQTQIRLISNDRMIVEDYENIEVETSDIDLTKVADAIKETLEKIH